MTSRDALMKKNEIIVRKIRRNFAFSLEKIWSYQKKVFVILQAFSRERCLSARDKAGTFINKNQLNKTTKCLYLAVGCFFYVRISHIPPRISA